MSRLGVCLALLWIVLSFAIAWLDLQNRWLVPERVWVSYVKLWIYWASWAALPLLLHAVAVLLQKPLHAATWLWACMLLVVAYSGLIEPRLLIVQQHTLVVPHGALRQTVAQQTATPTTAVQPLRIALVSDIHVGLFVRQWQINRLVKTLNAQDVDAVIVAGDWTYEPPNDLAKVFAPFKNVRAPVFGVLGNHDTQAPGPDLESALQQALQQSGVVLLDGKTQAWKGWQFVGLGDLWGANPRQDIATMPQESKHEAGASQPLLPRLVIMHQPDTAALMPQTTNSAATFMLSGHTHGGQIWLPWVTQERVLPGMSAHGWYNGVYHTPAGALFVSAGVGTIGLPARLGVVPRVDVITLLPSDAR